MASRDASDDPVVERFDRLARTATDAALVVSVGTVFRVGELDELARALGAKVRASRLAPAGGIGLVAPNGPGFLAGYVAARRAGHAVALLDWKTPRPERLRVAAALRLVALLTTDRVWPRSADDLSIERIEPSEGSPPHAFDPSVSTIRLTSGSTGSPRGILVPAEALVADDRQLESTMGLVARERILASVPLSHSYGFSSIALPCLLRGSVIVLPEADHPFGALEAAHRCEATFFPTVPSYLTALSKRSERPPLPSSLRLIVSAGAPLSPATAVRFREVHDRRVRVFYGSSECGGITFDREGDAGEQGTLGTPVDGVSVALVGDTTAAEGTGNVVVRSPAVAAGYFPRPDETVLGGGRFVSRDVARFEGPRLRLIGRADDIINVRGEKVSPAEVENVLAAMEGIEDVAVVGVDVPAESSQIVRAVVVVHPRRGPGREQIVAWCRARLAAHKVPRSIVLVDRIPRNSRGKIDRKSLERHG